MNPLPVLAAACEGCGDCCDPVCTRWDVLADPGANGTFARGHWTELPGASPGQHAYVCSAFDRATRRCTAYATRPPICRGFPWYGALPTPERARGRLPERCIFWRDVDNTGAVLARNLVARLRQAGFPV